MAGTAWVPLLPGADEHGPVPKAGVRMLHFGKSTLRQRLAQHCRHSHNLDVRKHSARLHFRCKALPTQEVVAYVEAVSIAAMDYPWNRRNEWKQHWALET